MNKTSIQVIKVTETVENVYQLLELQKNGHSEDDIDRLFIVSDAYQWSDIVKKSIERDSDIRKKHVFHRPIYQEVYPDSIDSMLEEALYRSYDYGVTIGDRFCGQFMYSVKEQSE